MGWNCLEISQQRRCLTVFAKPYVYFVHSYYLDADDNDIVIASANYGINFAVAVQKGMYLHPVSSGKSGEVGLGMLKNFATYKVY